MNLLLAFAGAAVICFMFSVCWFAGFFERRSQRWFERAPAITDGEAREIAETARSILPRNRKERQQRAKMPEDRK